MMKKNIKQLSRILSLMTLGLSVFISCSDDVGQQDVKDVDVQEVKVKNGYLEFRDEQAFENSRNFLKTKDREFLDNWEKQFPGFVSQRSLYEKAIEEELKFSDSKESVFQGSHSEFVKNNTDMFLFEDDGTFKLNLPITEEFISAFVTQKGLLKIGEKLYQYSENSIKVILDGDEKKLPLLSELKESSKDYGVLVYNITVKEIKLSDNGLGRAEFSGPSGCDGYTNGGGQRVRGRIYESCKQLVDIYGNYGYPGQIVSQTTVVASAENQIKNVFGWSRKSTNFLVIQGTVEVVAPINGGTKNVYATTSGNSDSILSVWVFWTPWSPQPCGTVPVSYSGYLEFYGRDGSNCSI